MTPLRAIVLALLLALSAACTPPTDAGDAIETVPANEPPVETDETPPAADPDPLGAILADVVTADGLVRYERLETEHGPALERVVAAMAAAVLPGNDDARLAFWCNAYNANVLAAVLREREQPSFDSVIGVEGFFDRRRITVAGESLTLNDLENERIRPMGDARIHAALVCAAMSCPPLRAEPYEGSRIDEQLDDQSRRWVNDAGKFTLRGGTLGMSRILDWYGDDFRGEQYRSPLDFVRTHAAGRLAETLAGDAQVDVEWLEYDWALNDAD